ncbi:sigma-54 dependent transcriptional regulator [Horticoccus luteus]|uniref:DNA-binding transcriptional regulator NtrC n=1 Tax=Horticoccus luteus TaxID=2862869 RepID=A0A8F9TZ14_9BACT|nr:sigma-54 dependent transcriptional regulator [Horticoccus luteus]QYM80616.1 sigma-54 dependent transcriptional regulator [Horticoccus luteus]
MPELKPPTILIIDDDAEIRYSLTRVLASRHFLVTEAGSGEQGVAVLKKGPPPDLIFLDVRMGGMSGIETLQHLRSVNPKQLVVLMTAFGTAQTAIEAMKYGAFDYVMKPFAPDKVLALVENALKTHADLRAVGDYKPTVSSDDFKEGIVGNSAAMQEVFKTIGQVTASDVTVMITGESGTGKELVARSIWKHSHRASKPFIAVNCAAIPDNLIESELFGHEKGAFTGATGQRIGKFELCDGGTIFLDEIGDMALATQTKILRVLQQGDIQRVGGSETIRVDVRILAATNKDLEAMVKAKTFREDLYYRLNVVRIRMPALRDRAEDIPQIVDFCLQNLVKSRKTRVGKVSPEALAVLTRYPWPGNVRELENVIYRSAVIAQGDSILLKDLPAEVRDRAEPTSQPAPVSTEPAADAESSISRAIAALYTELANDESGVWAAVEKRLVEHALKAEDGDEEAAAGKLGVSRATWRRLRGGAGQ